MRPSELVFYRLPVGWRWLVESVWRLEHAFERAKAKDKAEDDTRIRIFFVLAMFAAGFFTLALGAAKCALFSDADRAEVAGAAPSGSRADLVDRQGNLLAVDLTHYGLYLDPREIWDPAETRRVLGAALPGLNPARIEHALASDRREYLLGGLTPDDKARLQDMGLPGVSFEEEERRVYPLGATAAHLIGFADKGGTGLSGAEHALDDTIKSQADKSAPVALSMDLRVQAALDDEVSKAAIKFGVPDAVGIVTNVHTGEVLALSSWPGFDPNTAGQANAYNLVNRAAASVYEPGSVFKVFTMAMGLDSGVATMRSTYNVDTLQIGARTIHDFHVVHGALSLPEVFVHSSNIGTAKLALQAGAPLLTKYYRAFGLFAPAKIELAEAARPIVPKTWSDGTLASASFGQSISVSPLNLAQGIGAIMNGGTLVPLTIRKLNPGQRPQGVRVVSETTSRDMLDLMRLNVTAKEGSGGKADVPGLSVGGKTGTSQKVIGGRYSKDKVIASFAAVFPTDGPLDEDRYLVLIMLDDPKRLPETYGFATAGWNAAPAAGRVIDRIAPFLGVKRAAPTLAEAVQHPADAKPVEDETTGGDLAQ